MSPHAELQALSDNVLLARLRRLPRGSAQREAICEILVSRYAGLVRACARPYLRSPEPSEDLLQVGYVGLLKAINNFDPRHGDSLGAYAQPCISGEIKRHFRDRRWQLRVRRQDQELLLAMRAAEGDLTQQLGCVPDDSQLARHLGVCEDDPDLAHATDIEAARAHLDELPEREQRILIWRFYGNLTQSQIDDRLGISQMHVSRLLERALAYLRGQITGSVETT